MKQEKNHMFNVFFILLVCGAITGVYAVMTCAPAFMLLNNGTDFSSVAVLMKSIVKTLYNPQFPVVLAYTLPTWATEPIWVETGVAIAVLWVGGLICVFIESWKAFFKG